MTAVSEVPLLTLNGKEDRRFTLYASSAGKAEREGETTLWLRDSDHTLLASATFSVTRDHDARSWLSAVCRGHDVTFLMR